MFQQRSIAQQEVPGTVRIAVKEIRYAARPVLHPAPRAWTMTLVALRAIFARRDLTRKRRLCRDFVNRRGGREAEGGGLLNRYTV
jgi:hypothetical protein